MQLEELGNSLMKNINRRGPKLEALVTPWDTASVAEFTALI